MKYDRIDKELFIHNRKNFVGKMEPSSLAIFNSNDIFPISADSSMPFSQHRDILFLSGVDQEESILVISPNSNYNWIPSNIWVGVGKMQKEQVLFPLAPVYKRKGIEFHQALAKSIYPEGDSTTAAPFVEVLYTDSTKTNEIGSINLYIS